MARPLRLLAQFLVSIITIEIVLLLILTLLLSSCRTQYVVMPSSHTRDSLHVSSDHRYDSIYIDRWHTLILRGDTVFRTDSIYVEKLRDIELHDTITVIQHDSIPYPVEVAIEVEKPVPRFYRISTIAFWLLTAGILLLLLWRIAKAVYLRR